MQTCGSAQQSEQGGADEGTRTPDLRITNALLYQLSYIGTDTGHYRVLPVPSIVTLAFQVDRVLKIPAVL
jgi:hypothetical protein